MENKKKRILIFVTFFYSAQKFLTYRFFIKLAFGLSQIRYLFFCIESFFEHFIKVHKTWLSGTKLHLGPSHESEDMRKGVIQERQELMVVIFN